MSVKQIDTFMEFVLSTGGRGRVGLPSTQFLLGGVKNPFRIGATLANAAVTNSDLTSQDAWFEDVQVRTAFSPTDGSTTKLRAILSVEAIRVLIINDTFTQIATAQKMTFCQGVFAEIDVGGTLKRVDLRTAVREGAAKEFQQTQATATLANWQLLQGGWSEVGPGSLQIDLETNNFFLKTTTAPTFGSAISTGVYVEVIGHMCAKGVPGGTAYLPGAGGIACGADSYVVAAPKLIAQIANLDSIKATW